MYVKIFHIEFESICDSHNSPFECFEFSNKRECVCEMEIDEMKEIAIFN